MDIWICIKQSVYFPNTLISDTRMEAGAVISAVEPQSHGCCFLVIFFFHNSFEINCCKHFTSTDVMPTQSVNEETVTA